LRQNERGGEIPVSSKYPIVREKKEDERQGPTFLLLLPPYRARNAEGEGKTDYQSHVERSPEERREKNTPEEGVNLSIPSFIGEEKKREGGKEKASLL